MTMGLVLSAVIEGALNDVLRDQGRAFDFHGLMLLASADIQDRQVGEGLAQGDEFLWADLNAGVGFVAGLHVLDDFSHGHIVVARTDLGEGFVRAEAAALAAADVILGKQRALRSWESLEQLAHGGIAGRERSCGGW